MFRLPYIILVLTLLLQGFAVTAQPASVRLQDKRTKEAVAFAHLQLCNFKGAVMHTLISDIEGRIEVDIRQPMLMTISALGYQMHHDTLYPSEKKKLLLQPLVYNMDEVVVTGQYSPQPVDKSIFRVKVIGASAISRKASNNLSELMAGELNVRTSFDGALGSRITLQGLSGEHIKFLIDGVPLIGRMNGNIDLGQLNLHNVKQIEVIEGPMSVIYGSNALAGVINIITRDGNTRKQAVSAGSYLESVGVYNFNADASFSKNNWSSSIAAMRNFFDGFSTVDSLRSKLWKPKRQYGTDASLNYRTNSLQSGLSVSYFNELLKDKGNLMRPYYETAFDSDFITNRLTAKLDLNTKLFTNRFLNVLASYSYYDRIKNTWFVDLTTLDKTITANTFDQDTSRFNQYLLRAEFSKSTNESPFNYQLGLDVNYENGYGNRILDLQQSIGDFAGFLSVKWQIGARSMLQPGLRYAFNTKYKAPLVYSLNIKHDFVEALSFRGSYAKGFRAPSLKELYLEFVDVNHNIRGNESLEAESSHNVNMAFKYHQEKAGYDYGLELNLFYNHISNSISLATIDPESSLYTYVNLEKMITQGYQLQFNNRIYPRLEMKLGFGHTGRLQQQNNAANLNMIYSADVIATVNYRWQKPNLDFGLYYKYNGAYPEVFVDEDGEIFRYIMEGYHNMDLSATKYFKGNKLLLQIGAKNLFDNTNVMIRGSSGGGGVHGIGGDSSPVGWGRTYFIKFIARLDKTS